MLENWLKPLPLDNLWANYSPSWHLGSKPTFYTAGFELPAEALYLGKKLLVIPMKGQFEQQCNAASLRDMGITVLPSLSLIHHRTIKNWISIAKPLQIKYSTNLDFVIDKIVGDFESHKILTPELSRPIINLEFYKLFL